MGDIGSALAKVIEWVLVPLVLVLLWTYGFFQLPDEAVPPQATKGARAARWAGLILFVLFVLWRQDHGDTFLSKMPDYHFDLTAIVVTALGALAGFGFSRFVARLKGTKAFPFVVLVLVALMSVALYTYFFIWESRGTILFLALGFALGTLLDRAFSVLRPEPAGDEQA
ncbi:MAG TPA: hypothetical protein VN851_14205 [Thermoanaerobaculia bacterium]|nr:hypothetical protein [Thermoanaerobaculia bacterium]